MTDTLDTLADEPATLAWELMAFPDVRVTIGEVDRDQCTHCQLEDAVCTVRVHTDPSPYAAAFTPLETTECCGLCATGLVERALAEQDEWLTTPAHLHPIRVEIDGR